MNFYCIILSVHINTYQLETIMQDIAKIDRNEKIGRQMWEAAVVEMREKYGDVLNADFDGSPPPEVEDLIARIQRYEDTLR